MLGQTTHTLFAVARDGELVSDPYSAVELATQQRQHLEETLTVLGIESDLDIVSIEVKTSYGKPTVIKDPEPAEAVDPEQGSEPSAPAEQAPPAE